MSEVKDKLITAENLKNAYDDNKGAISALKGEKVNKSGTGEVKIKNAMFATQTSNYIDSSDADFWEQAKNDSGSFVNYSIISEKMFLPVDTQIYVIFNKESSLFQNVPIRILNLYNKEDALIGSISRPSETSVENPKVIVNISSDAYSTYSYARLLLTKNKNIDKITPFDFVKMKADIYIGIENEYIPKYIIRGYQYKKEREEIENKIDKDGEGEVTIKNLEFSKKSLNLFSDFKLLKNYSYDVNGGWLIQASGVYCTTSKIPVDNFEKNYYTSKKCSVFCYDSEEKYLGYCQNGNTREILGNFRLKDSTAYINVSYDEEPGLEFFGISDRPEEFKSKMVIPQEYIEIKDKNGWYGKKICTQGDSLTANGMYQPYLKNQFGFNIANVGVGGTYVGGNSPTAMWQDARINEIPTDTEVLLFMGGTNDSNGSQGKIGTIQDTGVDTFIGAYKKVIEKIYERVPNIILILMQIPWAKSGYKTSPNANGEYVSDYRDAVEAVAELYNLPLIDTYHIGINDYNYTQYMSDDTHHNIRGGNLLARPMITWFENNRIYEDLNYKLYTTSQFPTQNT